MFKLINHTMYVTRTERNFSFQCPPGSRLTDLRIGQMESSHYANFRHRNNAWSPGVMVTDMDPEYQDLLVSVKSGTLVSDPPDITEASVIPICNIVGVRVYQESNPYYDGNATVTHFVPLTDRSILIFSFSSSFPENRKKIVNHPTLTRFIRSLVIDPPGPEPERSVPAPD